MQKESIIGIVFTLIAVLCLALYLIPGVGTYPTEHGPLRFEDGAEDYNFSELAQRSDSDMHNVGELLGNNPMGEIQARMSEGSSVRLPFPPAPRFSDPQIPSLPIGGE